MQKSKYSTIFIILIIFIYIILSQFFFKSYGNMYTFIINPLFFIILALYLKIFILSPYTTNKFKKDIIQYVLIATLIYSLVYLLSGLLTGFGKNPYSTTFRGLIFNIFSTGSIIFCREYIRYKLLNNVYNKDKNIIFILLTIVFSITAIDLPNFLNNSNIYYLFKIIFYTLIPNILKNILFCYIAQHTDFIPGIIYDLMYYLILWLSPILPNSPWVLEAILNSVFPLILLLFCKYSIQKKGRFNMNTISEPINPSGLIPFATTLIILIWFTLGIFPIKPVGIATGSMLPLLKVGDLCIIQKCTPNNVKLKDIIEYQMEGYTVIHRVINIYQEGGEFYFITKGDNNDSEDKTPVHEDQLIGKVIFNIPYIATPTVWIHNLNIKTNLDVDTGK